MKLQSQVQGSTLIVKVEGELDLLVAENFRDQLDRLLARQGLRKLLLDLNGVTFIDSSGLGVIMGRYRKLKERGGRVTVTGARPPIERILKVSGFDMIADIYNEAGLCLEHSGGDV